MVERPPCQNKKKVAFGRQGFHGGRVITDPVAIVEDVRLAVNLLSRSVCDTDIHILKRRLRCLLPLDKESGQNSAGL